MAWAYVAMAGLQIAQAQGQAATIKAQAEIQGNIDAFNNELAEYDAWKTVNDGQTAVARYQNNVDLTEGTQRAMIYGRGQTPDDSSLGEVMSDSRVNSLLNKMDISNQAYEKANGYKREVTSRELGTSFNNIQSSAQASAVALSGYTSAAGTGLRAYEQQGKYDSLLQSYMKKGKE